VEEHGGDQGRLLDKYSLQLQTLHHSLRHFQDRFATVRTTLAATSMSLRRTGHALGPVRANLLSEYHIRHGGSGGIGYYHVSDTYIPLFSHFIPCAVWEAVYILDGLLKNESDIQPDVLHADTQGQSEPVFTLAHLLGIELMPRIRNWKDLRSVPAGSPQPLRPHRLAL
jgi:TnpA family transposase